MTVIIAGGCCSEVAVKRGCTVDLKPSKLDSLFLISHFNAWRYTHVAASGQSLFSIIEYKLSKFSAFAESAASRGKTPVKKAWI